MLSLKSTKRQDGQIEVNTCVKYIKIHSNCPPWLGENLAICQSLMAKNAFKLSTMV